MKSSTETLIKALEILAQEIESPDGVANAAIAEAAERLRELSWQAERLREVANHYQQGLVPSDNSMDEIIHRLSETSDNQQPQEQSK